MRRFSLFRRSNSGTYFVQFRDPISGSRLSPRSLRTKDKDEALLKVGQWLKDGIPSHKESSLSIAEVASVEASIRTVRSAPLSQADGLRIAQELRRRGLIDFEVRLAGGAASAAFGTWLRDFWKYETSPYIAERLAHGQRATRRHCQDMEGRSKEIEEILGREITLGQVKRSHLVTLGMKLKAKGSAAATVNKTLSAATTALRWAAVNEIIPSDPTRGIRGFSGVARKRGILEPAEVKALFGAVWADERARVACLVAATTGTRLGEILALRHMDIGEDRLLIRHSFSIRDGLKCTKTGEARSVPLLPAVRTVLLALEGTSKHEAKPERFIFAGRYPSRPLDANRVLFGMRKALVSMNGGDWNDKDKRTEILAEYRERGIDFHSWRHWFAKTMSDRLDAGTVQKATGHKTAAMLEHYADHVDEGDLVRLGVAAGEAFAGIIEHSEAIA